MPRVDSTKLYLIRKRTELILECVKEGYSDDEIGGIFNMDRSGIFRIRKNGLKDYRKLLKQKKVRD